MAKIQGLFKTLSWNSRTFQGFLAFKDFSRIYSKIQGLFKTVRTLYEFFFRVAKQYFTHSLRSFVKYCFCHEKIKFISSSRRVMFFLLYRRKDIDKIIEGNYIIDKLTCEIMENKPLGSRI